MSNLIYTSFPNLRDVATLKAWAQRYGYVPNKMASYIGRGTVELVSWPYWEDDTLCIKVREKDDPTTMMTVEWPQLTLDPETNG